MDTTVVLKKYVLENSNGMRVELLNLGARTHAIYLPVQGQTKNMLVSYDDVQQYEQDAFYLGATCGRVCNRISNARFELEGQLFELTANNGPNCLHGGENNFAHRYWDAKEFPTENRVEFSLISDAGDQGFPGRLEAKVSYHLSEENELKIIFSATTDAPTPVNLTNHAYFNLGEPDCKDLLLQVNASSYLELDEVQCPTGHLTSVAGSEFDFRDYSRVGVGIEEPGDQILRAAGGYDHCYVLDNLPAKTPSATLVSKQNGVRLELYSDQPGLQVYSGRWLDAPLRNYQGIALESQGFPDAINHAHFPKTLLNPEESYEHNLIYKFISD